MNLQLLETLQYFFLLLLITGSDCFTYPKELYGNNCNLEDGRRGVCKDLKDCPEKLSETVKGRRNHLSNDHCSFNNQNEIVCCPVIHHNEIKPRIADRACEEFEFAQKIKPNVHIVNGFIASVDQFPFMVALGYESRDKSINYRCGGSLISINFVLTAGHCVVNIANDKPVEIRMGSDNLKDDFNMVQRIPVEKIYPHPNFNIGTHYNDIALLKLKNSVRVTDFSKPACLQSNSIFNLDTRDSSIVASGFGATSFENEGSDALMKTANLSLVKNSQCNVKYKGVRKLPRGIDDSMLCYIDPNKMSRSDSCQGDSGGPLTMINEAKNSAKLIGVTSFGDFCGGPVPGVYTAVYNYLDWIEPIVWGNSF
ncbi:serine protease snake-like isoform X2 [Leptopilina heterotoma]|uniref:serine protease snake-like isoform X2 n=1 Tax=Leptopilina heterotoma TaxID=63436 RepID=UPI001CA93A57|nr:serine protease snake-like isoform X2 [Leptopilina heterotoma]